MSFRRAANSISRALPDRRALQINSSRRLATPGLVNTLMRNWSTESVQDLAEGPYASQHSNANVQPSSKNAALSSDKATKNTPTTNNKGKGKISALQAKLGNIPLGGAMMGRGSPGARFRLKTAASAPVLRASPAQEKIGRSSSAGTSDDTKSTARTPERPVSLTLLRPKIPSGRRRTPTPQKMAKAADSGGGSSLLRPSIIRRTQ